MSYYVVDKSTQDDGYHEVHIEECEYVPDTSNRISLGWHVRTESAISMAKKLYEKSNGCSHCCETNYAMQRHAG